MEEQPAIGRIFFRDCSHLAPPFFCVAPAAIAAEPGAAPVTVVEFTDYQCPFSRRFTQ
jgi:hypothetical protein